MAALSFPILSVNVATPAFLAVEHGQPVISAIAKKPVSGPVIEVGSINLTGDDQANRAVHGGPDKAVYAYPAGHWLWWEKDHGFPVHPGAFGENLTLADADEEMVAIGDRFAWGDAVLEIAQPRVPCNKFVLYTARPDAGALMMTSGRCGWYFRVIKTGAAPVGGAHLARTYESHGPSIKEVFGATFNRQVPNSRRRDIFEQPALSEAWRRRLVSAGI